MISEPILFLSLFGGILPALLWLWFWLREDTLSPEPRRLIIVTFLSGMLATLAALLLENLSKPYIPSIGGNVVDFGTLLSVAVWASIEEVCKFSAAYFAALRRRENDEPVDNMIYLITAALGFAALETAFFLAGTIQTEGPINSIVTGNLRFIGTAPLHIVCSATVGIFMAFAFCKLPHLRRLYIVGGLILASLLHTLFNFFILKDNSNLISVFAVVWIGVVVLLLFFEKVKRINQSCVY